MKYIDAHSHVWTPDTKQYPLSAGFFRWQMQPASFTAPELQKEMKPAGVNRVVLIQMSFYGFDNSYMLDAIRQFPEMFRGVAVIHQDGRRPDLEMRKQKKQGVRGFRIYPKNQPHKDWLGSEAMHTMWKTGAEEQLAMCCLMEPTGLPALDRMCRDFPETPVVIDHFCRIGMDGEIRDEDLKALCDMSRHKNVSVKVSAYYALGNKQPPYHDMLPMVKRLCDSFGPKRLMWASDCPFQVQGDHAYLPSIDVIKNGADFLTDDDREWILRKTAERVFFYE